MVTSKRIIESPHYKWWAYAALGIGMFLAVMDQASFAIALPRVADHFNADIPTAQWAVLGYVLATSVAFMPSGRLSDMVGRKPVFLSGLIIFIGASLLGGFSQTFSMLMVAKVFQGIGSACIQANGMAIVTEAFPERERGKALGLYMVIIGVSLIAGPLIGGTLVSALGWRWVFFISLPVGALAVSAAMIVFQPGRQTHTLRPTFDWLGAVFSTAALTAFLITISNAYILGWGSTMIVLGFCAALCLAILFIWWELRTSNPMLDIRFFKSKAFSMGVWARYLSFFSGATVNFLMPFYLVQGLGYKTSMAGLLMVANPVFVVIMGPIAGRLSDKFGTRWIAIMAAAVSALAMFMFSRLTLESSIIYVVIGMALLGAGAGSFTTTNTSGIMSSQDRSRYGIVSAFLGVIRTSADLTGVAVATAVVAFTMVSLGQDPTIGSVSEPARYASKTAFVAGMNKAFLVAGSCLVLASLVSFARGIATPKLSPPDRMSSQ